MASWDSAEIWQNRPAFGLTEPVRERCPFAAGFREWGEALCAPLTAQAGLVAINQAKLRLTDKYFSWRGVVPKAHRDRLVCAGGACLLTQFTELYEALLALELALEPPALSLPPVPKRPRRSKPPVPVQPDFYVPEEEESE